MAHHLARHPTGNWARDWARSRRAAAAGLALALAAGLAPAAPGDVLSARDAVYPALVNIAVISESFSEGRAVRYPSAGSGVIVTPEGHVLTNYHVAGDGIRITCTLVDGTVRDARVVAHDPLTDLSVLQLVAEEGDGGFPYATLGDSDALEVGEPVIAMGNPLALASSVTLGIVSNPRRVFTDFAGTRLEDLELAAGQPTGVFTRWIQHDALILPGNSGGPLVNAAGEVVGINELGGGFGFAIPSTMAAEVLRQAIEHGEVRRGWLGFSLLPVTKLGRDRGALVSGVLPGSPAAAAGLVAGDVLLAIGGEPVDVRFLEQIPLVYQRVAALPRGFAAALTIEREGATRELDAVVAAMPPSRGEEAEVPALGVTAREITGPQALQLALPDDDGLLITGVRPGYPAERAQPELAPGDVLRRLGDRPVNRLAELEEAAAAAAGEERLLVFRRQGAEIVSVVRLGRQEDRRRWGGELPQAWLGLQAQVLTPEVATALGAVGATGFRVTEVYPGTTAAAAGLAVGDLVTGLDGEPFTANRPQDREDLRRTIEARTIGDRVTLAVLRDGAPIEIEAELEAKPAEPTDADRIRQDELGFAVRELSFYDRVGGGHQPMGEGMMVVEVTPGGWAQVAGLEIGDLLMEIDGRPVPDAARFGAVVAEALAARPAVVRLFVQRGPRTHFVFIEPAASPPGDGEAPGEPG